MKIIKDPVHGYIEVPGYILPILDAPVLQRLRYIRQLGFSYLVYPGANHTRFEHSLGTMFLADLMARQLLLSPDERQLVISTALIHDIGHGPFSHAIEPAMKELCGRAHHDTAWLTEDPDLTSILAGHGIDTGQSAALLDGEHELSGILHGELDVDRMDYLLRDAHYTGVPYGTVDAHRLIRNTVIYDGQIAIQEGGINAAESLLIARTLMRPAVYYHHVSRIAEMMLSRAVYEHFLSIRGAHPWSFMRLDDAGCFQSLLHSPSEVARVLIESIYSRRMYKRALYVGKDQVNMAIIAQESTPAKMRGLAARIAKAAGVEAHEVLVDIPEFPKAMSVHVKVKNRDRVVGLEEISPLVTTLNETRRGQWRLGVYSSPGCVTEVGSATREILHVKPFTTQDRLPL
ncbi:MAG TPA: HD domain-containing protein [Methanoregulaceae archaeon]|nr:MAG: HD domain-containing protein [Methanolinea sp.]HON80659.1 HD domain-containing protein [Methanoregulaceae archaeon]HPD09393.1 HD domain-containing protein [Methanoregulaceae archaeon]HRT14814.1 HD domain-containing protein [Methanoregulaceae archaeon]HRU30387.1 HD domain-containing protein [Methanoregulaceae archaeon]